MQSTDEIKRLEEEIAQLKKRYHTKKEELEYAEDDFEEGLIQEELDRQKREIKSLLAKLRSLQSPAAESPRV